MPDFDFIKNTTVETLETVPEKYRGLYAAGEGDSEGKHVLSDAAKGIVADYTGTHAALTTARDKLKKSNDENAQRRIVTGEYTGILAGFGLEEENQTPEGLKVYVADLTSKVKGGAQIQVDIEKIRKDHAKSLGEVTTNHTKALAAKDAALSRHMIGEVATRAIAAAKGAVDLLLPHIISQCKVVEDGDDYVVRVFDSDGNARSDGAGGWLNVEGLVTEMKASDAFGRAFDSEASGGGGMKPGSGGRLPGRTEETMSPSEKIARGLATAKKEGRV